MFLLHFGIKDELGVAGLRLGDTDRRTDGMLWVLHCLISHMRGNVTRDVREGVIGTVTLSVASSIISGR
jgi:hypothetical protein